MPPADVNSPSFWDRYMQEAWERNGGREQTRLFAHYFLQHVGLPTDAATLLDCSCAMGDAIPEFHRRYPSLTLTGIDVSPTAVEIARVRFGTIATFQTRSLLDIDAAFDLIYCSNTLEHFERYLDVASGLLGRCRRLLYVMVPYREMRHGKHLTGASDDQHVVTFDRHSFDTLVRSGEARRIRSRVLHTPGAWGHGPYAWTTRLRGWLTRNPSLAPARQIIFEIERVRAGGS